MACANEMGGRRARLHESRRRQGPPAFLDAVLGHFVTHRPFSQPFVNGQLDAPTGERPWSHATNTSKWVVGNRRGRAQLAPRPWDVRWGGVHHRKQAALSACGSLYPPPPASPGGAESRDAGSCRSRPGGAGAAALHLQSSEHCPREVPALTPSLHRQVVFRRTRPTPGRRSSAKPEGSLRPSYSHHAGGARNAVTGRRVVDVPGAGCGGLDVGSGAAFRHTAP